MTSSFVDSVEQDLTKEEAQVLTASIRQDMENVHQKIIRAYRGRAWLALGYISWNDYCDKELAGARPEIEDREQRREIGGEMRQAGMSYRAISSALGVGSGTVHGDLSGVQIRTPAPERITGTDGRSYASSIKPVMRETPTADPEAAWSTEEKELRARMMNGETVVVSLRGAHGHVIQWAENENRYERIDRRSEWGNPFEMPMDGDRETVIRNYNEHYLPYKPSLLKKVIDLRGKALGCWCAPEPCHGNVLVALSEWEGAQ